MLRKADSYFHLKRTDIATLIEQGQNKILESGCAAEILKKQGKVSEIIGIELVPEIAERAKCKLDKVISGLTTSV
jgi:hypothetical protein